MRQNPACFRKSLAFIVIGVLAFYPAMMMLSGSAALALGGQVKGGGIKRKEVLSKKSPAPIARRSTPPKPPNNTKTGAKNTVTSKPSSSTQSGNQSLQAAGPCGSQSISASAHAPQKKRRPNPTETPSQQTSGQNTSSPTQRKTITLTRIRCSDTADGAVVTIEADQPLNNYSAYRSGDKYYVVIPDLDARSGQNIYRNIQMQKNDTATVFTFRMQPGAKASVRQRFNHLDVVFTLPRDQATPATNANKPPD